MEMTFLRPDCASKHFVIDLSAFQSEPVFCYEQSHIYSRYSGTNKHDEPSKKSVIVLRAMRPYLLGHFIRSYVITG